MIKSKKQMYIIISSFLLILLLTATTYAFFNYTRTGSSNVVKTGHIEFNTNQDSTITLTNIFPVESNSVGNDYTVDSLQIAIDGNTTYDDGVEYLVTIDDANLETSTHKKVPLSINMSVTGNLGTEDTDIDQIDYFNVRGGNTSYYKKISDSISYNGEYLLVGYIAKGATGIDGVVNIKAYLDKDKIGISDTYDGTELDNMGTTNEWANGKTILTTTEWNSLQTVGNELSFKVKVEANEGIWVDNITSRNDAYYLISLFGSGAPYENQKSNVREISFVRMSKSDINKHQNIVDLTESSGEGEVSAWIDGDVLYIASTGETYLPDNAAGYFNRLTQLETINFYNINTSNVTLMDALFQGCTNLKNIDLSDIDTSSITSAAGMFNGCTNIEKINMSGFNFGTTNFVAYFSNLTKLKYIDLSNADTSGVANMSAMFNNNTSLSYLNLTGIDTSNVTVMSDMFKNCNNLERLDLSGFDTSSLTNTLRMFAITENSSKLKTIYVGSNWNMSNVTNSVDMFSNCTSLIGGSGTRFDSNHIDKAYAHVDGGTANPGYLTLKSN